MQRARDWLREAQAELGAARNLLAGRNWSWCCFTCQQAAEKALKAIGEHFRSPQLGHNLNLLVEAIRAQVAVPPSVEMACARLNRHYIPTRYPNAFDRGAPVDQFFEPDARQALEDAQEVVDFATRLAGPP
ncbi:MAG: HEPN domain-containing protein [Candidatus Rokubacteria bacterium]|nr:HEPN domain-containing protein [Candidatus Rokubacteria bacterium]